MSNKYGDKSKNVLDYGCGSGYGTNILSKNFQNVIGVDVVQDVVDYCRTTFNNENCKFQLLDPNIQPFDKLTFDYIFSFQVFEHVPENMLEKYIMFIWDMLKINGIAIITTPNSYNYFGGFSGNVHHVKEYNEIELKEIFSKVIPQYSFNIYFVEDVLSTRLRLKARKVFRNNLLGRAIGGSIGRFFKYLERFGIVGLNYNDMFIKNNFTKRIGSFYIEINKNLEKN